MKATKVIALAVMSLLVFTGCGSNKNQNSTTQAEGATSPAATQNNQDTANTPDTTNQTSQKSVASEHYLSLGTLKEEVVIEGENRDRDEVEVSNGKLVFPRGTIRSVIVKDADGEERFVDVSKKKVNNLISVLEREKCTSAVSARQNKGKEIILVYQTDEDDNHTIYIQSVGNDNYFLRVKEDDRDEFAEAEDISDRDSTREYDAVQIHSKELTTIMNQWMKK